jgi:protoheme IX farnesyltransferase
MILAAASATPAPAAAGVRDYFDLMKPRVMSLVVFTGLVGWVAAPGAHEPVLAFAAILAIAAGAGAAGALNMWADADIDALMLRTRKRPIPAGRAPREEALSLGLVVGALSVLLMALAGGAVAAALLGFTIWFYAVPYSMWLKRTTPENIVIGGLSGALPPAIAWTAATGSPLALEPWLLVAIIFVWTPPHFWALALKCRDDYAAAGVPMLPVTHGPRETRRRIFAYTLLLAPLGVSPALIGLGGWVYAVVATVGGVLFVALAARLLMSDEGEGDAGARRAMQVFAFSILYLFGLFTALFAEHAFGLLSPVPWSLA